MSDQVTVTVEFGNTRTRVSRELTPWEALVFLAEPLARALDDGEASWALQDDDVDRLDSLSSWANGLNDYAFTAWERWKQNSANATDLPVGGD